MCGADGVEMSGSRGLGGLTGSTGLVSLVCLGGWVCLGHNLPNAQNLPNDQTPKRTSVHQTYQTIKRQTPNIRRTQTSNQQTPNYLILPIVILTNFTP
jgi:hypothetical protein